MKLYYYRGCKRNFGDDLNAWLWDRVLPDYFDNDSSTQLCGIGTLIGNNMPIDSKWIILGSGVGYLAIPVNFNSDNWNTLCVRGPLTAEILGLHPEKAITDGAFYLSFLPEYTPMPESERHGVVFMPHHKALIVGKWKVACELAGIEFLNPEDDDRKILERLRSAKLVIAEAMHAAIVADTLRVPWIPVATSVEINSFKWLDWTMSMELPYNPISLPQTSSLESFRRLFLTLRGDKFFLSKQEKDLAIAHFKRMQKIKSNKWWALYKKATGLFYHIGKYSLMFLETIQHKKGCGPHIQLAADALCEVVQSKSYLSDNAIFEKRKSQMKACLEEAKRLASPS